MNELLASLVMALTGIPALAIAFWAARDGSALGRMQGLHWALIALSIFLGAAGLYWAAGSQLRAWAVVIVLVLAVNGLALSLIVRLRAAQRGRRG